MVRMYPIFTDGKKFYHSDVLNYPKNCRFVYFSELELKEWKEKEEKKLYAKISPEEAYNRWIK